MFLQKLIVINEENYIKMLNNMKKTVFFINSKH